jgi:tetratricopeptide (TPR) repeat protein
MLAVALIRLGETAEAIRARRTAAELDSGNPDRRTALADILIDAGNYHDALDELNVLDAQEQETPDVQRLRGLALYELDEYAAAADTLTRSLQNDPNVPESVAAEINFYLGESYRLLGRYPEALEHLDHAVELAPHDDVPMASRGTLQASLDHQAEALDDLQTAVSINPGNRFAIRQLWTLHSERGRPDEGIRVVQRAHAERKDDLNIAMEYASALTTAGRCSEAKSVLEEVLWQQPDDVEALQLLGTCLLADGDREMALTVLRQALRTVERWNGAGEQYVEALTTLALAQSECGDVADAVATVDRALQPPRTRRALLAKGQILVDVAAWTPALTVIEEAVTMPPFNAYGYGALGWVREHAEGANPDLVFEAYDLAARLSAGDPGVHRHLGNAYWLLGKDKEAERQYRWVVDRSENVATTASETLHGRGWCLYRLHRYPEASRAYLLALSTAIDSSYLLFDIGLAALESGDRVRGETAYERALVALEAKPPLSGRAPLSVALHDLRIARPASSDIQRALDEMATLLERELHKRPLPADLILQPAGGQGT